MAFLDEGRSTKVTLEVAFGPESFATERLLGRVRFESSQPAMEPKIFCLEEPTTDLVGKAEVREISAELKNRGRGD